ncbi:TVP38/TMEM64 family protein [Bremerella cremea]|nr:VTT domain-containing protein [Bremerella cremea]
MPTFLKMLALVAGALAIPIIPFVIWGHDLQQAAESWQQTYTSPAVMAIGLFGLLAFDVFLPVPSSLVNTIAGAKLGILVGSLVCFAGLTVGAALGFGLAKMAGPAIKKRWLEDGDATTLRQFADTWGVATLVITRPLPILAEAAVVLLGVQGLAWRKFWAPVLLANSGIAVAYAAFGQVASDQEWLVIALGISAGFPLLLTYFARKWLQKKHQENPL